jgi:hypothetical protein
VGRLNKKTKIVVSSLISFIAVIGLVVRTYPVFANGDGNLRHELHWIAYGYDRVWYRDRTYINPTTDTLTRLESLYGKLLPTGEKVIGFNVLNTPEGMKSPYALSVLILQKDKDNCLVYELSGGP